MITPAVPETLVKPAFEKSGIVLTSAPPCMPKSHFGWAARNDIPEMKKSRDRVKRRFIWRKSTRNMPLFNRYLRKPIVAREMRKNADSYVILPRPFLIQLVKVVRLERR